MQRLATVASLTHIIFILLLRLVRPHAGNLLTDWSVCDLAAMLLAAPCCASLEALDLSGNALLTWRCCEPLATLLRAGSATAPLPARGAASAGGPLALKSLRLEGVQLECKGAQLLASALASSTSLQVRSMMGGTG